MHVPTLVLIEGEKEKGKGEGELLAADSSELVKLL